MQSTRAEIKCYKSVNILDETKIKHLHDIKRSSGTQHTYLSPLLVMVVSGIDLRKGGCLL